MLDPISAFAAITAGHKTIMGAIKIGKDLSSLSTAIGKFAQGEAHLQHAEAQKKKSKFSFAEDSAIEKHFKKEALEDMRDELRKAFQYFGKDGQWERLQAEIAQERARIKKELAEQQRIKDRNLMITTVTALVVLGTVAIVAWIKFLQGGF
jgi:serine/threonine protein phosphatase PrpC